MTYNTDLKRCVCAWISILCCVIGLSWLAGAPVSAQTMTPPPMPFPTIQIDSIAFDDARGVFRVQLLLSNQGMLWELQVKVENARSGVLVYQRTSGVQSFLEIPVDDLKGGDEYNLTITGLNTSRQPLNVSIPNNYGGFETRVVQDQRRFIYSAVAQPDIEIVSVDFVADPPVFQVTTSQQNAETITAYRAWLENSATGLRASQDFPFSAPLNGPLIIPLGSMSTGRYHIVITALNGSGAVVASVTRQNVDFVRQEPTVFQRVEANPVLLGIVVVVTLILLVIVLRITVFKPRQDEYTLKTVDVFRGGRQVLLSDDDKSRHKINNRRRAELQRAARRQPGPGSAALVIVSLPPVLADSVNRIVPIGRQPFTLGRENQDLTLPLPNISMHHADITCDQETYYITDKNSRNNTYVNRRPIGNQGRIALHDGDEIRLAADVVLRFEFHR